MKIGQIEIPELCRLAPMAAIINTPFRLIARECGSGLTTTEEMDAFALLMDTPRAGAMAAYSPEERPLAMQLLGKDPQALIHTAHRCEELGADIVDLNMGCPMPKMTGKGKGAALMRGVPATTRLLRAMRQTVAGPFTIKIRGGWDDEHLNAVEVARMAEGEGVDAITVHSRSQRFTGKAPWAIIAEVVQAVRIPVTGNGDVRSMAEARRMVAETGCASVMIGRASSAARGSSTKASTRSHPMPSATTRRPRHPPPHGPHPGALLRPLRPRADEEAPRLVHGRPRARQRVDRMKLAGLPLNVVADTAPQEHPRSTPQKGRGQPWTILALMSTRRKVRSVSLPKGAN